MLSILLNGCGIGVGVGAGTSGRCGVDFTTATGGDVTGAGVALGSGDTTILTAFASGGGVGVELLMLGVGAALKGGAADVVKAPVTAGDFGTASTLLPALSLTQSSISGSKRSRSFARACSRSTAICVLTRPLSVDRFLLKLRISSAVSRLYMPCTIAGTRTVHNV